MPLWLPILASAAGLVYAAHRDSNKDEVNDKREMEREAWRLWRRKITSLSASQNSTDPRTFRSSRIHRDPSISSSLEIQNDDGKTAMSISEISDPNPKIWVNVDESVGNPISRLNPLLSAVPLAVVGGDAATTRYMRVELAGNLTRAADGGGYRALKVGGGGIEKHARLFSPNQLRGLVTVAALWQIASVAVAQKHLHDISKKLETINRQIEQMSKHLKDDRISKVLGCRKYFAERLNDIECGIIMPDRSKTVIENQCMEILKVEEHLRIDLKREINKEMNLGESFNEQVRDVVQLTQQLLICIETRLLGYNLMAEDGSFVDNRLNEARRDMTCLKEQLACFADYMFDTLSEEASFWGNIGKYEEALALLEDLEPREKFEESFGHVCNEIEVAQNILEQRKAPQEILLKVNGGNIDGFAVEEGSRFMPG